MKQFHSYRLDVINHCLWNGENRVVLTPKAFDVLRYLVEHADRLVTQDEILGALWPETYVNPEVIKKYVLGIRRALGDRHEKPEFIETFPRRGYQFVALVSELSAGIPSDASINGTRKMVGREAAMTQLDGYLGQALKAQRQVIFITGEAGVGKTTLIDEFHQTATRRANLRVIRGQCVEGFGGKEAYYPVLEALGQWVRDAGGGGAVVHTLAKQAPTWLIQFPSLIKAEQREALQKEILGATRERMVREICEALESLTAQDPLVLILEDLHWVDPSTLDFISAVARRRGPAKLLLLGTYRPVDVIISQSPLKALKQDLVIHNLSQEIALERLEETDVAEYIAIKFVDRDFPEGFANLIYRHSGGNALFMVTILQDMVKKGLIAQSGGGWTLTVALEVVEPGVPETLDQLIEAQFQQLSAEEQQILRSASVAGERFSVWAITTAESDAGRIEDACAGLAERLQFIETAGIHELANGQISAHYDFRHSLYREVLYRRLSEVTRSKLHLQLAQRLKAFCDPCEQELATELALHFEGGHDYAQAIRYLMHAAVNAARRFAYRDSIEILRNSLELVSKVTSGNRMELEIQTLVQMGDIHYVSGNMADSAQAYEKAASQAAQWDLGAAQVTALIRLAHPMGLIDVDRAVAAVEKADEISASLNDPMLQARTQILASCARLYYHTWRSEDAELYASAYQTIQRLSGSGAQFPEMHYAHLHPLQGGYREALRIAEAGILKINETTSTVSYLLAIGAKAVALMHLGQLGDALQVMRTASEGAAKNGNDPWLLTIREAWLRTVALDFEGARQLCETMIRSSSGYPKGQPKAIAWFATANAALAQANYDEALQKFRQVLDKDVTPKFFLHWYWRMHAQLGVTNVWLASGNLVNAHTEAGRLLECVLSTADPGLQALAWDVNARVAITEKNWKDAEECVQKGHSILAKFEIPMAAWRLHGTAWDLYRHAKNEKAAETYRKHAETCILKIANSFAPDEPLRATFLDADPVRRILREKVVSKARHQHGLGRIATP